MQIFPWQERLTKDAEAVLFLFLMFKESDYSYNISRAFQKARDEGIWNRKDCADLLYPNKVTGILNRLADRNVLIRHEEIRKVGRPKKNKKKDDERGRPAGTRIYFSINPAVLACSHDIQMSKFEMQPLKEQFIEFWKRLNKREEYREPLNAELLIYLSDEERERLHLDTCVVSDLLLVLTIFRQCNQGEQKIIKWLNKLKKINFLTILIVVRTLIVDMVNDVTSLIFEEYEKLKGKTTNHWNVNSFFPKDKFETVIDQEIKRKGYSNPLVFSFDDLYRKSGGVGGLGRLRISEILKYYSNYLDARIMNDLYIERGLEPNPLY